MRILRIAKLAGGETILLRCRGKGCPFKSKRLKAKRAGTLKLDKLVRRARLRRGVKLEVTITKLETVGRVTIVAIRRNKAPRISRLCLPPGATKPAKCA